MIINKNRLRIKMLILFLCFFNKVLSQERLIHQNDSIYKLNKVKSIKKYGSNYLDCTVLCDKEGRWIEYIGEPVTSGWQKTEYFEYNDEGKLGNYFYRIQDNGKVELKTESKYLNGQIVKLSHYNQDGSLNSVEYFEDNGKKRIFEQYENEKVIIHRTNEYDDNYNEKINYSWRTSPNSEKIEWIETFKYKLKNGLVQKYTRYDNGKRRLTTHIKYYKNNLIEKVIYNNRTDTYKYEFY